MSHQPEQLERHLQSLTEWHGETEPAWEAALDQAKRASGTSPLWSFVRSRNGLFAAVFALAGSALLVAFLTPSLRGARDSSTRVAARAQAVQESLERSSFDEGDWRNPHAARSAADAYSADPYTPKETADAQNVVVDRSASISHQDQIRHVIRNATIELESDDVRAAFLKAAHLVRQADGEFVQDSALTGSGQEGDPMRGEMTLRVSAARLSELMNDVRTLGNVVAEETKGQDVTSQVVDLEARLRNEQRIETELLDLLAAREEAPLKEIMELRTHLSQVRQEIERLVAQRDRLSHLVSMATVLVILREIDAPSDEASAESLWDHFRGAVAGAWQGGMRMLADTVAAIVHIAVAGLIWWVLLAAAAIGYVRHRRTTRLPEVA